MKYSVELLTAVPDCETLTKKLTKEKDDQDFRVYQLTRQIKTYAANTVDITSELLETDGVITSLTNTIATMPEGKRKEDNITDLDRAKLRKRVLLDRQNDYGSVALIERQVELSMSQSQLVELNDALAQVEDRQKNL